MRKITTREKTFLAIGVLAAVGIFVYFILWPMLQGEQSGSMSSLEKMQERLESIKRLEDMSPLLVKLEERMESQSGYKEMSFRQGTAGSMIFNYLAQTAAKADIKDLEQLYPKPDTSRKTRTDARSDQAILDPLVNQLYLCQVIDEMESLDKPKAEGSNPQEGAALSQAKEKGPDIQEEAASNGSAEEDQLEEDTTSDVEPSEQDDEAESGSSVDNRKNAETEESTGDVEQIEPEKRKLVFPPVPMDIPVEVKRSLAKSIETNHGKTIGSEDIDVILADAGVEDSEREVLKGRLQLYNKGVKEKKKDIIRWLSKFGISQNGRTEQKTGRFTVKMVFKSRMDQLVKLLYNLQESAKWLKIESIHISISDRKQTVLAVELSMTATALYDDQKSLKG